MLKIFVSYSRKDSELMQRLHGYLIELARRKNITLWSDHQIIAGQEFSTEIFKHLSESQVVLLLLSIDFLNSEFCSSKEMVAALELHYCKRAVVIPVIVRPIPDHDYPFNKIQALPRPSPSGDNKGTRAMTAYANFDSACVEVCKGIEEAIDAALSGILKDINNSNIDYRAARIEETVREGEILKACDLLMQYCIDFSPHNQIFKFRATSLKGTLQSLIKDDKDNGDERYKLIIKILTLMEEVRLEPLVKVA